MTLAHPAADLEQALAQLGKDAERLHVPGVQVAVVHDNAVLHAGGIGLARLADATPVGPRTLFHHGSCGKAYTGLLAVLLAADGVLDLDVPVRTYVPELSLPDAVIAERVTIRDLISHRSGLARHDVAWIANPSWSREEMVRRMAHLSLVGDLRAQWQYSNFGFALAGLAIGRATGSTWEEQLHTRLLEPAGMTRACTDRTQILADDDCAEPYVVRDGVPVRTEWRLLDAAAPAGGIMTSAEDAATWLLVQLGAGSIAADLVVKTQQLQAPIPPDASPFPELRLIGYGLGWGVGRFRGRSIVWHTGGIDGFYTYTVLLPDDGMGVTVSTNVFNVQLSMAAGLDIVDALLGESGEASWVERMHPTAETTQDTAAGAEAPAKPMGASAGPSHPVEEYAATYRNDGYGELVVTVRDGGLAVRVGELEQDATHRHFDTWGLHYAPLDLDAPLTFNTDADGVVAEALVRLDETTEPIRYVRVPEVATK